MSSELEREFPKLCQTRYKITSPKDPLYNCIAWAAGDNGRWWWPAAQAYWPQGVPLRTALDLFAEAFRDLGYECCDDASLDSGWEKIAIYARQDGSPTHATRQLSDGTWTSKLGRDVDISHDDLNALCGRHYGTPALIMRRRVEDKTAHSMEADPRAQKPFVRGQTS